MGSLTSSFIRTLKSSTSRTAKFHIGQEYFNSKAWRYHPDPGPNALLLHSSHRKSKTLHGCLKLPTGLNVGYSAMIRLVSITCNPLQGRAKTSRDRTSSQGYQAIRSCLIETMHHITARLLWISDKGPQLNQLLLSAFWKWLCSAPKRNPWKATAKKRRSGPSLITSTFIVRKS